MRDSRRKACPNFSCEAHKKKVKYGVKEMYCSECGSKLVFVCKTCGKEIVDEGPEHKLCPICQAKIDDRNEKIRDAAKKLSTGLLSVGPFVAAVAVKTKDKLPEIAEKVPKVIDVVKKL